MSSHRTDPMRRLVEYQRALEQQENEYRNGMANTMENTTGPVAPALIDPHAAMMHQHLGSPWQNTTVTMDQWLNDPDNSVRPFQTQPPLHSRADLPASPGPQQTFKRSAQDAGLQDRGGQNVKQMRFDSSPIESAHIEGLGGYNYSRQGELSEAQVNLNLASPSSAPPNASAFQPPSFSTNLDNSSSLSSSLRTASSSPSSTSLSLSPSQTRHHHHPQTQQQYQSHQYSQQQAPALFRGGSKLREVMSAQEDDPDDMPQSQFPMQAYPHANFMHPTDAHATDHHGDNPHVAGRFLAAHQAFPGTMAHTQLVAGDRFNNPSEQPSAFSNVTEPSAHNGFQQFADSSESFMDNLYQLGNYEQAHGAEQGAHHSAYDRPSGAYSAMPSAADNHAEAGWIGDWTQSTGDHLLDQARDYNTINTSAPQGSDQTGQTRITAGPWHGDYYKTMEPTRAGFDPRAEGPADQYHVFQAEVPQEGIQEEEASQAEVLQDEEPEPHVETSQAFLWRNDESIDLEDLEDSFASDDDDEEDFDAQDTDQIDALMDQSPDPHDAPAAEGSTREELEAAREAQRYQYELERKLWGLPEGFEVPNILVTADDPVDSIDPEGLGVFDVDSQTDKAKDSRERSKSVGYSRRLVKDKMKEARDAIMNGMKGLASGMCRVTGHRGSDSVEKFYNGLKSGTLPATFRPEVLAVEEFVYSYDHPDGDISNYVDSPDDPLDEGKPFDQLSEWKQLRAKWSGAWDDDKKGWTTPIPEDVAERFRQAEAFLVIVEEAQSMRELATRLLHVARVAATREDDYPLWIPRHRFMSSLRLSSKASHPINFPYINDVNQDATAALRHEAVAWNRLYRQYRRFYPVASEFVRRIDQAHNVRATNELAMKQTRKADKPINAGTGLVTQDQMVHIVSQNGKSIPHKQASHTRKSSVSVQEPLNSSPDQQNSQNLTHGSPTTTNQALPSPAPLQQADTKETANTDQQQPWQYAEQFQQDDATMRQMSQLRDSYISRERNRFYGGQHPPDGAHNDLAERARKHSETLYLNQSVHQELLRANGALGRELTHEEAEAIRKQCKNQFGFQRSRMIKYRELAREVTELGLKASQQQQREWYEQAVAHAEELQRQYQARWQQYYDQHLERLMSQASQQGIITEEAKKDMEKEAKASADREQRANDSYKHLRENYSRMGHAMTPELEKSLQDKVARDSIRQALLQRMREKGEQWSARKLEQIVNRNFEFRTVQAAHLKHLNQRVVEAGQTLTPELKAQNEFNARVMGARISKTSEFRDQLHEAFHRNHSREPTAEEAQNMQSQAEARAEACIEKTLKEAQTGRQGHAKSRSMTSSNTSTFGSMFPSKMNRSTMGSPAQGHFQVSAQQQHYSPAPGAFPRGHSQNGGSPAYASSLQRVSRIADNGLDGNNSPPDPDDAPARKAAGPAGKRKRSTTTDMAPPPVPEAKMKRKKKPSPPKPKSESAGTAPQWSPGDFIDLTGPPPEPQSQASDSSMQNAPPTPGRGKSVPHNGISTQRAPAQSPHDQQTIGNIPCNIVPSSTAARGSAMQNNQQAYPANNGLSTPQGNAGTYYPVASHAPSASRAPMAPMSNIPRGHSNEMIYPSIESIAGQGNQAPNNFSNHHQRQSSSYSNGSATGDGRTHTVQAQTAGFHQPSRQNHPMQAGLQTRNLRTPTGTHDSLGSTEFASHVNQHDQGFHLPSNPPPRKTKEQPPTQSPTEQPSPGVKRKAGPVPEGAQVLNDKRQKTQGQPQAPTQAQAQTQARTQPRLLQDLDDIQHEYIQQNSHGPVGTWDWNSRPQEAMAPPALPASALPQVYTTTPGSVPHIQPGAGDAAMIPEPAAHREDFFASAIDPGSDFGFHSETQMTRFDGARGMDFNQVGAQYGEMYPQRSYRPGSVNPDSFGVNPQHTELEARAFTPRTLAYVQEQRARVGGRTSSWYGYAHLADTGEDVMVKIPPRPK